ncbi:hypothetical protein FACS1894164_04430 [Spirochaetia bacterium]|nr:hypothetical protein FACS1894164_04430 [Spirochaetia bacterium]
MITKVFSSSAIKVPLEALEREEVFEELVDYLCQATHSREREQILEAIRARESKMSTGIRKGIAIPHGKTNAVSGPVGVLGLSRNGIDYGSPDGEPVHILFMIVTPIEDSETHLRLLMHIAELFEDPNFYNELLAQKTASDAYTILQKYEDLLITKDA